MSTNTDSAILQAARAEAIAFAVRNGYGVIQAEGNDRLEEAIERCLEAAVNVDEIVASVPQAEDPANKIEVDALQWKREMLRSQIERAARAARERKAYLATLRTEEDWEAERARCGENVNPRSPEYITCLGHWFRYWAWALDPRSDLQIQPFVPFGLYEDDKATFQWGYVVWLHETTFKKRKSGVVEKARDMGATLGWLLWATQCWLFTDNFNALLASANEDLVDHSKDPDTLFAKVRFALKLQPPQMLPESFNLARDMPYMNIENPENGSVLSGQAPTPNAGRQKRRKCILKDESAAWPQGGFPQNTSLSAVSNSNFDVSSVQGKYNQFHVTATHANANKYVMDWRDHPWKDQRWYDSLPWGYIGPAMSAETIAQEVDRDYDASQPGKVFKDWEETRTCVEWSEVLAYFVRMGFGDRFRHVDGTLKIPADCHFARMQDKGETAGHPRMTLYCFRPGQGYPLSDSIFFFIEHMAPTAADLGTVVTELEERCRRFHIEKRRPQRSLISHEARKDRGIYMSQFGWKWDAWDTDYDSGIGNIRLWLKAIDAHKDNPIRPQLKGRSRMYLVCAPGQAKLLYNEKDKKHFVSPALDSYGFKRLRAEFPVYHYPPEEAGKPVQDQRPLRDFDDALVCFVEGTPVVTDRGEIPIEQVTTEDRVATRYGWRQVIEACQTKQNAVIFELSLSHGEPLRGTGEHPIWVEGIGWTPLRDLQLGDALAPFQKWWNTEALSSTVTPTRSRPAIGTTSCPTSTTPNGASRLCTSRFGRIITALCHPVTTFITSPALRTILEISNASPTWSTNANTDNSSVTRRRSDEPQKNASRRSCTRKGVATAKRDLNQRTSGQNIAAHFARVASAAARYWERLRESAPIVARSLTLRPGRTKYFAVALASLDSGTTQSSHTWSTRSSASGAEPLSPRRGQQDFVPVSVKAAPHIIGRAAVYNLEVEEHPEYFANGILVHNCVRGIAVKWGPSAKPETEEEKKRRRYAPEIRPGATQHLAPDDPAREAAIVSQMIWDDQFKQDDQEARSDSLGPTVRVPTFRPRRY